MYADQNGDSHFEDVEVEMSRTGSNVQVSPQTPSTTVGFRSFPHGWSIPPNPAPRRLFVFILTGEVELATSDGTVRNVGPGDVILTEDTMGKGHGARVVGTVDSLQAFVQLADGPE